MTETVYDAGVVGVELADRVATIRLDRPKMNPIDLEVMRGLVGACDAIEGRDDVDAVVVYGGERVFAAGADIKWMRELTFTQMADYARAFQECMRRVDRLPMPTIAAITGYALGAGSELALACDFRVLASDGKVGQPEVLLGVIPGCGGSQRLPRLVGVAKAKDLIFTGRFVDADEALAIGYVDEVVEPSAVYDAALARAKRYAGGPRYAIRFAKEAIDRGLEGTLETGLDLESQLFTMCFATQDRTIGMDSFVEQGPGKAQFSGG